MTSETDRSAAQDDNFGPDDYRRAFEATIGIPFTDGNTITPLKNGMRIFPAMIDAIAGAQQSIDFLTFVYWEGDIAERFGAALAERAVAGVRVRVLLDSFGAHTMPDAVLARLREAGAEVAWFRPKARWRVWQVDNRTHRKILIVDGDLGFTGGVGIAAEWDGDARGPNEWRETHFQLQGPCLDGLRGGFLSNWVEAGRPGFENRWEIAPPTADGDALIQVLRTSAAVNYSDVATLFRLALRVARHRVRITTGYFVPDDATIALMKDAVARGAEVEVLMPGPHTDSVIANMAAEATFETLLEAGVKLYRYQPTMLHAKIVLLDDVIAISGSANFNHRSMGKDDEIVITMIHPPTYAQLDADFDADRERCRPIVLEDWRGRSLWQRLREQLGSLLSPQA